ncbi:MAG: hypothetical protein C4318_00350 [Acidimicrobiia bacterium]
MPEIEFLILADSAEVVNNKLYMMGGGWNNIQRRAGADGMAPPSVFSVAISVLVGWHETNVKHKLHLRIEDEDATQCLAELYADFEVGRPSGIAPGSDQRALLAITASVAFPSAGIYRVLAEVGDSSRSVSFQVHDLPPSVAL